ncbi:hypothetical protein Zm00014a_029093 [Zea mays]|uniref:Helitron helicase-like domain-containing protein n=1 Tax=Zea mays TaxID=4577 RepID=A0A3L6EEA5_MAIZE|nr:hypothetical protein Zm00014a_029093 [Zea mays]
MKNELKKRRESCTKENLEHHKHSKDECPDMSISDGSIIDCTIPCDTTLGGRDDARQRKRERERVRYATMSAEKKNELKKRRESRKKGNVMHHEYSEVCNIPANKDNNNHQNNEIEDVDDDSYRLHKNNSFETSHQHDSNQSSEVLDPRERKRIRERTRFATQTKEQRALRNSESCNKMARKNYKRRQREIKLQDLIGIEDPKFTPELVWSSTDAEAPHRSLCSSEGMAIPELSPTPFVPNPSQTEDVEKDSMTESPRRQRHKRHVSSGQRQTLVSRQNQKFHLAIGTNFATATRDRVMENDVDNEIDHQTISEIDNNESTGLCPFPHTESNNMTEGADIGMQHQEAPTIDLAPFETPSQLRRLWECADADARHFCDNIRFFNGHFSFTSLYCCLDNMTTNMDRGIYTFRAHGMMYHNVRSFGREAGAEQKHLELYFYDDDPSLEHRYHKCRQEQLDKDKAVIKQLVEILKGNPYTEHLRSMGHVDNIEDYHIALNLDQTLNQKLYNAPITSEVAAVWIEGSERRGQFNNSVMLHGKDRSSHDIRLYHGCYDALSYPLFFPKGELGWHANIPKSNVSMNEVEAYRDQHRARDANDDDTG